MRLDKFLAHNGFGTRKEVKSIIKDGIVEVNNKIVKIDKYQIDPNKDVIKVNNEIIEYSEFIYYMLNKPSGYVSATVDNRYPTVIDLIDDYRNDLFPVGRLDIDTEGLLIITNDGVLAHKLLSPKHNCPKVYYAIVEGIVDNDDIIKFKNGVIIDTGYLCKSSILKIININDNTSKVEITIYEGKFHQIKKMFEAINKKVVYLKRIKMSNLELDETLELGKYKLLSQEDLNRLL